ncbi:DUF1616 domain-containing protein [Halosimplex amylolyticum]|uniref:DUF1616 domain-containing protein n=1 Tax=Halosimplex amylolyticum TaxID=3396616 RepID=UPI003F57F844
MKRDDPTDGHRERLGGDSGLLPQEPVRRTLTVVLLVVLASSVAGVVYVAVNPPETTDPYTEFYVLGPSGNASDYPTNLTVGESGEFIVGLTNHEHGSTTYSVVARLGDRPIVNRSVTLADEETWESNVSFVAESPGEHRLRILLYKDGTVSGEPDDSLRLFVTVSKS